MQGGDNIAVIAAGLPNITGASKLLPGLYLNNDFDGAIKTVTCSWSGGDAAAGSGYNKAQLFFDASQSNDIYGANVTVQPPSISLLPQIKY